MGPQRLIWKKEEDAGQRVISMQGTLDLDESFSSLRAAITGPTCFDLAGIRRITSYGVQKWIELMRAIDGLGPHRLRRCSAVIVDQINMITDFAGNAAVISAMAPFYCKQCDLEQTIELDTQREADLPSLPCPECGAAMALDDLPSKYLRFRQNEQPPAQ